MKLSRQALTALMLALQKSLLEQSDIVPVLLDFNFIEDDNGELLIKNAPTVDLSQSAEMDFSGLEVSEEEN